MTTWNAVIVFKIVSKVVAAAVAVHGFRGSSWYEGGAFRRCYLELRLGTLRHCAILERCFVSFHSSLSLPRVPPCSQAQPRSSPPAVRGLPR